MCLSDLTRVISLFLAEPGVIGHGPQQGTCTTYHLLIPSETMGRRPTRLIDKTVLMGRAATVRNLHFGPNTARAEQLIRRFRPALMHRR